MKNLVNELPNNKSLYNKSEIFKAIADPIRMKILYLLKNGELCACNIDSSLDRPQSTIAHHLSILKKVNLLNWRKEGKWTYYRLANPEIIELIEQITSEKIASEEVVIDDVSSEEVVIDDVSSEGVVIDDVSSEGVVIDDVSSEGVVIDDVSSEKLVIKENFTEKIITRVDDNFLKVFENKAKDLDIFKVGYTKIEKTNDSETIYENLIVLAIEIDENIIKTSPGEKAKNLNKSFYTKFRKITEDLSEYLNLSGFKTQIAYPNENLIDLSLLGQKAGLGYLGKSGLLITPEFGSKIKLSGILTSLDDSIFNKPKSVNKHKWIKEQCNDCEECIESCESEALIMSDGDIAEFSEVKCIGSEEGCTFCIEKCPFNEKGYSVLKKELSENLEDKSKGYESKSKSIKDNSKDKSEGLDDKSKGFESKSKSIKDNSKDKSEGLEDKSEDKSEGLEDKSEDKSEGLEDKSEDKSDDFEDKILKIIGSLD